MPIASSIYSTLFKRNYTFVGTVFVAAFAFEMLFDKTTDTLWNNINKDRQWKDIRHKYIEED